MNYNLILDSNFKAGNHWKYNNCEYKDGYLLSNNKVFGIEQELVVPSDSKLYFRINYMIDNISINNVKIGVQYSKKLECNEKIPKLRKQDKISVVCNSKEQKIKVHIIFESTTDINKAYISEPILVSLNYLDRSTWLKFLLDKTISYREGYSYTNLLDYSECNYEDLEKVKVGTLFKSLEKKEIEIDTKLTENTYYLIKLDIKEINQLGNIYFKYGVLKSTKKDSQLYLVFKGRENLKLSLCIEPNDVLPYQVNLKHIMLLDISKLNLMADDLTYLPFV